MAGNENPFKRKVKKREVIEIIDSPPKPKRKKTKHASSPPFNVMHCPHVFTAPAARLPRISHTAAFPPANPEQFWGRLSSLDTSSPAQRSSQDHVQDFDAQKAIAKLKETCQHSLIDAVFQQPTASSEIWTRKCAPRTADQVLGQANRSHARYLKEWLQTLALKSPTGLGSPVKQVIRGVASPSKKRKKKKQLYSDDLDDFIAYSDEDINYSDSPANDPPISSTSQHRFEPLTNCILLEGPHSSGKTCTVHALAEELGWQIYEVNPGSSKRSFKELLSAVGEVGKYHSVVQKKNKQDQSTVSTSTSIKNSALASIFKSQNQKMNGKATTNGIKDKKEEKKIEQSLILIEEVDILFPGDKSEESFWDGVVQIVSNSRRPVILTCNDSARIPLDRLMLQSTLKFEAPPVEEVTPFLQALAYACKSPLNSQMAAQHYSQIDPQYPVDHSPSLIAPRSVCNSVAYDPSPSFDLRRTICQYQFWLQNTGTLPRLLLEPSPPKSCRHVVNSNHEADSTPKNDIHKMCTILEYTSQIDAFISRRERIKQIADEYLFAPPLQDRELGYQYIDYWPLQSGVEGLADYLRDAEIAQEILTSAGDSNSMQYLTESKRLSDMQLASDRYHFLTDCDGISLMLPREAPLITCPTFQTDYLPFIVEIISADDRNEANFEAIVPQANLQEGRRSRRLNANLIETYQRHLQLNDEDLASGRKLRLLSART